MRVSVLYFGMLKDLLKTDGEQLDLPADASVETLVEAVRGNQLAESGIWKSVAVAVNREYASLNRPLKEGDEVALLPPVSGGGTYSRMRRSR